MFKTFNFPSALNTIISLKIKACQGLLSPHRLPVKVKNLPLNIFRRFTPQDDIYIVILSVAKNLYLPNISINVSSVIISTPKDLALVFLELVELISLFTR